MKKISPILFSIFSIYIVVFFWHEISLPYDNSNKIVGNYSENNHHQFNDTLRFICFLILPLLIFITTYFLLNKEKIILKKKVHEENFYYFDGKENLKKRIYLILFVLLILFFFISSYLPDYKLDIFHEGQLLTGALNNNLKGNLFIGSYINTGLFYDILNTKFFWYLFNTESIGAYRLASFSLNYIYILFVIILIYKVSTIFNFSENQENFYFVSLSTFCIYYYLIKSHTFPNYRDLFTIFFLICLINIFKNNKYKILNYILVGGFSVLSILWSLDRGIFLNATIIVLIGFLFFRKKKIESFLILLSIIISWTVFFILIGKDEFNEFIFNSVNILKYNEIWNGIIHPQPFSDEKNSTRATKALLLYILNAFYIIKCFLEKESKLNLNAKYFLTFTFLIGIFYYKIGLSRSDGGHIVIGSSINYILFVIIIIFEISNFFKNKLKSFTQFKIDYLLIFLFISFSTFILYENNNYKVKNFLSFKSRVSKFIEKDNSYFLSYEYLQFINKTKKLIKNNECIQNFTYDPSMYYLLNKKSCTQYYLIFNMATVSDQNRFIQQIEGSDLKLIIVDKNKNEFKFSANDRFPIVKAYITRNFETFDTIYKYQIMQKK